MRFLHTADWQLGLKLRRLSGDRGARARDERFRCVERIATLAHDRDVDAVLVAGDVFDDNQVSGWVEQRARDALARFAPIPVLLLPGNHDAAEPGGVLARFLEGAQGLDHVQVLLDREPLTLGDATVFPCPLFARASVDDPTAHVPPRDDDTGLRVVVAHGGVHDFGSQDAANLIDVERLERDGVDWIALGDWHGLKHVSPRAAYPGAPEPTRFKEQAPGQVLIVDVAEAGAVPQVEAVEVQGTWWHEPDPFTLRSMDDVEALDAWLAGLDPRGSTLVRLHLQGALPPDARGRLDDVLAAHEDALLSLQLRTFDVRTDLSPDDLAEVDAPGFLGDALQRLVARDDAVGRDAARLLMRLIAEGAA